MITETRPLIGSRLIDLFYSRVDVFPYQWWSEARQIGGYSKSCRHRPPWNNARCAFKPKDGKCAGCDKFEALPVDQGVIAKHLAGSITAGSYQLAQDGVSVKWGCLDFDDHGKCEPDEVRDAAVLARMVMADWKLPMSLEASGGNGWRCHLWLFFSGLVPAIKVRTVLDAALREVGLHEKPFIERFPKQSRALNGYGNLVKLPFGRHQKTGKWSHFLDWESLEPIASTEVALASIEAIDPISLDFVLDMHHLTADANSQTTMVRPAKNFDYPADEMRRLLSRCWWFKEVERQQISDEHSVHYEDWWAYLLALARFGDTGSERIMQFSQRDERFNEQYTLTMISYIRDHGYHMPSCRRLREGPGQIRCPYDPLDCGAI